MNENTIKSYQKAMERFNDLVKRGLIKPRESLTGVNPTPHLNFPLYNIPRDFYKNLRRYMKENKVW